MDDFCDTAFWNTSSVWEGTWPHLTECFQNTVLIWIPCGWLWVASIFYLYALGMHQSQVLTISCLYLGKLLVCGLLAMLNVTQFLIVVSNHSNQGDSLLKADVFASAILFLTVLLAIIIIVLEHQKGFITSGVLFIFWLLLAVAQIVPFYSLLILQEYNRTILKFSVFYIHYFLILLQLVIHCFAEKPQKSYQPIKSPCLETEASFLSRLTFWWANGYVILFLVLYCFILSRLTFWWANGLLVQGYQIPLTEENVSDLNPREKSCNIIPKFWANWSRELQQARAKFKIKMRYANLKQRSSFSQENGQLNEMDETTPLIVSGKKEREDSKTKALSRPKPSLLKILLKTFGLQLLQSQIWKLFYDVLLLSNPLLLGQLILFVEDTSMEEWKGYLFALALFASTSLQSLFFHQLWHQSTSLGLRIRTSIISTVFRKALTMNNQARRESTVGEVVNLMSVDAEHIEGMMGYLWSVWSSPLQICVSLYLLYSTLGPSMFAGLGLLILLIPINGLVISRMGNKMTQIMSQKDKRMKIINEVLNGIKILKLYAWEKPFSQKICEVRNQELNILWQYALWMSGMTFSWTVAPYAVSLVTFITYIYTQDDHYLRPNTAFVAISLFNIMRFAINFAPMVLTDIVKALISIRRLNRFLSHDDLDEKNISHDPQSENAISITDGTFTWNSEIGPTLKNINLNIPEGSLIAVVGQVGSGKSSLVSAVIGDIQKVKGQIRVKGSLAYVSQQAWIQNDTVRRNILFGQTLEQEMYDKCISACALNPDLNILPAGDLTEIGERGINLSGGQKQRVSLARAIYSNADIYLLDDPLSAVDSHVGKHIFEEVIGSSGLLKDKTHYITVQTRILVTHGVHWLPLVDQVIVMKNGTVSEIGSYKELLTHNGPFAQFLRTYFLQEAPNEEEEDPEVLKMRHEILQQLEAVIENEVSDEERIKLERQKSLTTDLKSEKKASEDKEKSLKSESQNDKLIEEEKVEIGRVRWDVFKEYAHSVGYSYALIIVLVYALYEASAVLANIWLSNWTDDSQLNNLTALPANSSARQERNNHYLYLYGAMGAAQVLFVMIYSIVESLRTVHASRVLHEKMLHRLLRAPMSFFDTTPLGRIVNRFSKDIDTIDSELPLTFIMGLDSACFVLSTLIVISYSTPYFLIAILPLLFLYLMIQRFYIPTSRQLKRLSSKTRSPIYNFFSETVSGASVIRAFGKQAQFIEESERRVDLNQTFRFYSYTANRWLGIRLEFLGNMVVLIASVVAVALKSSITGGIVGLSISYALEITANLNWLVRMISDLETQVVCVERVKEYAEIETEAPWTRQDHRPPFSWPQNGEVIIKNFSLRYRSGLDLVLKNVSVTIQPGEKVGIVGRTGAGKSSLTLALFRLLEPAEGEICIDNVDIVSLGLHDLRTKLTILPQDPVIFAGSLRMNLDPFGEYSDNQVWAALEHAHLHTFINSLPDKLDHECGEGGENLSMGQRQLLCLARSLLRKTKILVLDEATAAVDMETDELIQHTIRQKFADCTVLTIAHRLNTVMDYDKILVLSKGQSVAFDTPENLLKVRDGIFYQMASSAGLV